MTASPRLYVDSCVFIAAFETSGAASVPARTLLDRLAGEPGRAVTSELTLAELLVPSERVSMPVTDRRRLYLKIFDEICIVRLAPVTRQVLLEAAEIQVQYAQRLPDAIHIATATLCLCTHLMTFDRDARRRPSHLDWLSPTQNGVDAFLALLDA